MAWGSCVLHVVGEAFEPDDFLSRASLAPYQVYHRGQPQALTGKRASLLHESSGFKCDVSEQRSLGDQLRDAFTFLTLHKNDLALLSTDPTVEERQLDFGYQCRIGLTIAVHGEYLPAEFLRLAGELRIGVALSLYPGDGENEIIRE